VAQIQAQLSLVASKPPLGSLFYKKKKKKKNKGKKKKKLKKKIKKI